MGFPPLIQPVTLALMLLFGLYLLVEVHRWLAGNRSALTVGQFRRRLVGAFLLELDLLLWFLANPLMRGRRAADQLLYLLLAMLLLVIPMLLAVRESAFVARQYLRWRSELIREMGRSTPPESPPGPAP